MYREPISNAWFTQTRQLSELLSVAKTKLHTFARVDYSTDTKENGPSSQTQKVKKKILYWNTFWGEQGWSVGFGDEPFRRLKCGVQNCELTENKSELESSNAVLFHIQQLEGRPPPRYSSNQRWIFWMLESPGWSSNLLYTKWNGLFNWTMTYRIDSDIRLFYGKVERKKTHSTKTWNMEMWNNKTKLVAWMTSYCDNLQSQREEYVKELQR